MATEITGKIFKILDIQKGESSRGPWQKGGFVIETESNFPKKVCCTVWGDLLNQVNNLNQGDRVTVAIDIESREYNDRWYTDVKAWQIRPASDGGQGPAPSQNTYSQTAQSSGSSSPADESQDDGGADDLPF